MNIAAISSRQSRMHAEPFPTSKEPWEKRSPNRLVATETGLSNQPRVHALRFGRFRLVLHSRELLAGGVPQPVSNRALDVLFTLIDARGQLVTKDELLSRVWPNTTVEENNLQFQVSTLRKVLREDRDLIRTVSGRGYRFVAEITAEYRPSHRALESDALEENASVIDQERELLDLGNPAEPTSGIAGREIHLMDIGAMTAANRLVTLVGVGGIGKTRLAIELARRTLPTFANDVSDAEFGKVSEPGIAITTATSAAGLGNASNSLERTAASLDSKHLLLLLDSCEHIIESVTSVAEALLQANAKLKTLRRAESHSPLLIS